MKSFVNVVVLVCVTASFGCSSLDKTMNLHNNGSLTAEPMKVMSRPLEYGIETLGAATGEASYKKFLFFTIEGESASMSLPIAGLAVSDPLERIACFKAVQSLKGDGFYKLSSQTDSFNFMYIFRQKNTKVTGNVVKIKDLGLVDQPRADSLRKPATTIKETIVGDDIMKALKGSAR